MFIGDFLRDGQEYIASIRDERYLVFRLLGDYYSSIKTVDLLEFGNEIAIFTMGSFVGSDGHDNIIVGFDTCGDSHACWNGQELIEVPGSGSFYEFVDADIASGIYISGGSVIKDIRNVLHVFDNPEILRVLDSDIYAYQKSWDYQLVFFSLSRRRVISRWGMGFEEEPDVCYLSTKCRSKIILIHSDDIFILDISEPEAVDITNDYNLSAKGDGQIELMNYDERTGSASILVQDRNMSYIAMFRGHELVLTGPLYEPKFLNKTYFVQDSCIYKYSINDQHEFELSLKCSLPLLTNTEHTYRDLAGTIYFDELGMFRKSLTYCTSALLSERGIEPVNDIFMIDENRVLMSGERASAVVNPHSGDFVESWYRSAPTLFASEHFQVTNTKVYSRMMGNPIELPEPMNRFALHGEFLVVGNSKKVILISQELKIKEFYEEEHVYSVFSGGYVTSLGIKFFDCNKEDIVASGVVGAALVGSKLFVITIKGELYDFTDAKSYSLVDLNLESTSSIYDCGNGTLIVGANDSFLYNNGEYFSVEYSSTASDGPEKILISRDLSASLVLEQGVVYLKTSVGLKMTKKSICGTLEYSKLSVYEDKVAYKRRKWTMGPDTVFIRNISGGAVECFLAPAPPELCRYFMLSDEIFAKITDGGMLTVFRKSVPHATIYKKHIEGMDFAFELANDSVIAKSTAGGRLFIRGKNHSKEQYFAYQVVGEVFEECGSASYDNFRPHPSDNSYKFGMQFHDYIKSDDYWIYFDNKGFENLDLIPRTCREISRSSEKIVFLYRHSICCTPSAYYPGLYFVLAGARNGRFELNNDVRHIFAIRPGEQRAKLTDIITKATNLKCNDNHGRVFKYQPEFIATNRDILTVTMLPPNDAKSLQNVQKALIPKYPGCKVKGEIDGNFLLTALMDPANHECFKSHNIDPQQLKTDLWNIYK